MDHITEREVALQEAAKIHALAVLVESALREVLLETESLQEIQIGGVTVSGNRRGNPYHDARTGKFTTGTAISKALRLTKAMVLHDKRNAVLDTLGLVAPDTAAKLRFLADEANIALRQLRGLEKTVGSVKKSVDTGDNQQMSKQQVRAIVRPLWALFKSINSDAFKRELDTDRRRRSGMARDARVDYRGRPVGRRIVNTSGGWGVDPGRVSSDPSARRQRPRASGTDVYGQFD